MKSCSFSTTRASVKAWFITNGLIDKYFNIKDLAGFRKNNTKWSNHARNKYGVKGRLFAENYNGTKAFPNEEMLSSIDRARSIFYQSGETTNKIIPDSQIESTIHKWLSSVGIQYKPTDKIYDVDGNEIDATAKADMVKKTIEVVEGKRDIYTLPEEAAHMFVRMLGSEHSLVKAMMNNIDQYDVYNEVVNSAYGELYKNDENKLREEAVGKLISQIIVAQNTDAKMPSKKEENRWNLMWNWLKNRLKRLIGTKAKEELSAYNEAANMIMENKEMMVSKEWEEGSMEPGTVFYQLNEEEVAKAIDKLKSLGVWYNPKEKAYFGPNGKRISKRVTDLVKKIDNSRFKKRAETEMSPNAKLTAAGGTVAHEYLNQITVTILDSIGGDLTKLNKATVSHDNVQAKVKEALKDNEDINTRPDSFTTINPTMFSEMLSDVKSRLKHIQKTQDFINKETNTKGKVEVMPEFTIYNPTEDVAGTIDLLVIYSNGVTSIYDYKGRKFFTKDGEVTEEFPLSKVTTGENQIAEYKSILKSEFGIEDFGETRLVPMNLQFSMKRGESYDQAKISTIEIGAKDREREYLEEVPVTGEETGIKVIDKQLNQMFVKRDQLRQEFNQKPFDANVKAELERITRSIRKLQLYQDTRYLHKEVSSLITAFKQKQSRGKDGPDPLTLPYMNSLENYLKIYSTFFVEAKSIEKERAEDAETKAKIDKKYNELHADVAATLIDIANQSRTILEERNTVDFDQPVQEMGQTGAMFRRLSQFSRAQFKALYNLLAKRGKYVRDQVYAIQKDLMDKKDELQVWANNNNMSLENALKKLISDKGSLKSKYNGTFGKEKAEAIENKDLDWFLENTNVTRLEDGSLSYKDEESLNKLKEAREKTKKIYETQLPGEELAEYRRTKMQAWDAKHNITTSTDALYKTPYYVKAADKERFLSEIWLYMSKPENKALKDTYETLINYNRQFAEITGRDISENFIAEVQSGTFESLSNWRVGIGAMRDNIKKSFMVREQDVLVGSRDPESGDVIPNIPLLYSDKLTIDLTSKEVEAIKKDLVADGLTEEESGYIDELEKAIRAKEREKGVQIKSKDLFTSALLFAETAYTYEYSKSIEDEVKALKRTFENAETDITSPTGKKLIDAITGKAAKLFKVPKSELEAFDKFVNLQIYGSKIQNKDFATDSGLSLNKTLHQALRGTSLKALGLSYVTGIGNAVGISGNTLMLASEGLYFNKKQVKTAISNLIGRSDDLNTKALLEYFSPYSHNITFDLSRDLSVKKARKYLNEEMFYLFMKYPDKAIDAIVSLGVIQEWGINKNGQVRKKGKEDVTPLTEILKVEDDKIVGLTEDQYVAVRKLMTTAASKIKGSMSKEDQNLIGTTIYSSMLMQFRNWMPGLINTRFQGLTYEQDYDVMEVGRFKVLFGEFTKKGLLPKINTFANLLLEVGSLGAINKFSNAQDSGLAQKYLDRFLKENKHLRGKITLEQFIELRKQKLKGMAAELQILGGLYGIVALVAGAIPDDADGENAVDLFMSRNAYKLMNRGLLEISFFFDPTSLTHIIDRPVPIWRTFKDIYAFAENTVDEGRDFAFNEDYKGVFTWEKDPRDRTGPLYYTSKLVPIRLVTDLFDFHDTFDQYMR